MKKKRWPRLRIRSYYAEYRDGPRRREVPPHVKIFTGKERDDTVAATVEFLKAGQLSRFQNEGEARSSIRATLCLRGFAWNRSDTEAAMLIAEALVVMGAKRPTWDEGQWNYSIPRENCARCAGPIDDDDQARGFRYCSVVCASADKVRLAEYVPHDHHMRQKAYLQATILGRPARQCPVCENPFWSHDGKRTYCSLECKGVALRKREELTCSHCSEPFVPVSGGKFRKGRTYCSRSCASQALIQEWQMSNPAQSCPQCYAVFRPRNERQKFCSSTCTDHAAYRRRTSQPIQPPMHVIVMEFDRRFVMPAEARRATRSTPELFDFMMEMAA